MEKRLQEINNDTVLEVTETAPIKQRYSESALLSRKEYYETMIAKCQAGLLEVNTLLSDIAYERNKP